MARPKTLLVNGTHKSHVHGLAPGLRPSNHDNGFWLKVRRDLSAIARTEPTAVRTRVGFLETLQRMSPNVSSMEVDPRAQTPAKVGACLELTQSPPCQKGAENDKGSSGHDGALEDSNLISGAEEEIRHFDAFCYEDVRLMAVRTPDSGD